MFRLQYKRHTFLNSLTLLSYYLPLVFVLYNITYLKYIIYIVTEDTTYGLYARDKQIHIHRQKANENTQ